MTFICAKIIIRINKHYNEAKTAAKFRTDKKQNKKGVNPQGNYFLNNPS